MATATELIQSYNGETVNGKLISGLYNLTRSVDEDSQTQQDRNFILPSINEYKQESTCVKYISEVVEVKTNINNVSYGGNLTFKLPIYNHYYHDICAVIEIDQCGTRGANARTSQSYLYCDYPGLRLFSDVIFKWNQLEYERYNSYTALFHRRFNVPEDSRRSFDLSVGQEVENYGYIYYPDLQIREKKKILNGPQTRKTFHDKLVLTIPLLFSFCTNIADVFNIRQESEGSDATIEIKLEDISKLFYIYDPVTNTTTPATIANAPRILSFNLLLNTLKLPIDNVASILRAPSLRMIKRTINIRTNIQMVRGINRYQIIDIRNLLTHMFFGFRNANNNSHNNWHLFGDIEVKNQIEPFAFVDLANNANPYILGQNSISYNQQNKLIDKMKFTLGSYEITTNKNSEYHSNYLSTKQNTAQSPEDDFLYSYYVGEASSSNCDRSVLDLTKKNDLYLEWESLIDMNVELVICANIIKPTLNNLKLLM
jgi:hypothetical protein